MTIKKSIFILLGLAVAFLALFVLSHVSTTKKEISQSVQNTPDTTTLTKERDTHAADTIPGMAQKEFAGKDLQIVKKVSENESYTRYQIAYTSEGFNISGVMNVPKGPGPFPVIIMNHGYLDPQVYRNGDGLPRELDYFPRHGYVVLHSDYRNYALSDFDPNNEVRPRSGYVEDVLNLISALKKSNFNFIDKDNIGMFGHSMGGGITLNIMVTKPDIAKAYILYAPINADYKKNFDRWVSTTWPDVAQEFYQTYGTPEENPQFWHDISAKNFFANITKPILLHQGTADSEVPVEWSQELNTALRAKGKNITYYEYPGQPHVFTKTSDELMLQRSLQFFNETLR